jgi:signal transduction histidine kinase
MLDRQVEQRATITSEFIQLMLEHEMLEGTPDHARLALEQAARTSFVQAAYILDNEGRVRYAVRPDEVSAASDTALLRRLSAARGGARHSLVEGKKRYDIVLIPIRKKAACFTCHQERSGRQGTLALRVSREDLRSTAAAHRRTNALMAVGVFVLLGGALYWILALTVIRPVRLLHRHVAAVRREVPQLEQGTPMRLEPPPVPPGRDEIAGLGREFAGLVEQLNEANARLLRLTRERLEHAERLSSAGQMAASVAHEIRNPVAGVRGALEIFAAELPPGDERIGIISEMKLQLDRVNHAISDLLAYARPTPPLFADVHVRDLVERTTALFGRQLQGGSVALRHRLSLNGELVLGDGRQLQQVLWNLLLNASQAMPAGGTITVAAAVVSDSVELRVEDTGAGIPPEIAARVFEPFFTTKHTGTGLGMTISRRIVEQHGGGLVLESTPGAGTHVVLRLPLHRKDTAACAARP